MDPHNLNPDEVKNGFELGAAVTAFFAAVWRLLKGSQRYRGVDMDSPAPLLRIEAKLDQMRIEMADDRRAQAARIEQLDRRIADHEDHDNSRFEEVFRRLPTRLA